MPINTAVEKPGEIYQIKVTLLGTDPPIWRRLLVPADLTLERLHDVLQLAVGWEDCHMHEFRIGKQRFGKPDPLERAFGRPRTASERTARLFTVLDKARAKAVYTYDFGDGWDHEIVVEKCLTPEPGRAYPACLAGERHGPPEDCGGLPGFHDMLEAISDPRHEQHDEILEWLAATSIRRLSRSTTSTNGWRRCSDVERRPPRARAEVYSSRKQAPCTLGQACRKLTVFREGQFRIADAERNSG
jgi:hypothetical protein